MNFRTLLDWIVGKKPATQTPPPTTARERRKYQRVDLPGCQAFLGQEGPFPLSNMSFGGVRIHLGEHPLAGTLAANSVIDASLHLQNLQLELSVKVCNNTQGDLGCSFPDLSPAHARILADFLKPRILGSSLQEANASAIQSTEPNLRLRWFQGEEGTQIFLWQRLNGGVVKEEYYFLDYVITWNEEERSLQTGRLNESLAKGGFGRIDPRSVAFFQVPSHRALKMGKIILNFASLPSEAKDPLLSGIAREERRLSQRYVIGDTDRQVGFRLAGEGAPVLPVANLSTNGLAIVLPEHPPLGGFDRNAEIHGDLKLDRGPIPLTLHIAYVTAQNAGGFFKLQNPGDADALAEFLAPRLLGQSLEELPAPLEDSPGAPPGSRGFLFVGLHNTQLMSLVAPGGRLVLGRLVFMDRVLTCERSQLKAYSCPRGIIFPRDWDLPPGLVEQLPEVPEDLQDLCHQLIEASHVPGEIKLAWKPALG